MADSSKIEWTQATWNPVVGCQAVSPGCDHCYAASEASGRLRNLPLYAGLAERGVFTGEVRLVPERLDQPLRWTKPRRVFVNSMSDLFHDDVPDEYIARVWQVMGAAPQHTYQILTKRHARMRSWATRWYSGEIPEPFAALPVPGYPGYQVTTHGEVLGKRAGTSGGLSHDIGEQGHRRVTMHRADSPTGGSREFVHRLVLTAFSRPPHPHEQACHRNGDPSDNRLSNLYWGGQDANWSDRLRHGNGRSWSKPSDDDVAAIRSRADQGQSAYAIAKDYPVSDTQIHNVLSGRQWSNPESDPAVVAPARSVLRSVWLGVSVEDQKRADLRIPALLDTPAAVHWLSCEPLLGPINLTSDAGWPGIGLFYGRCGSAPGSCDNNGCRALIDWAVVGGESGPGARPMHPDWARSLRDQCGEAGVAYFFKQWGAWAEFDRDSATHLLHVDGKTVDRRDATMGQPIGDVEQLAIFGGQP